MGRAIDGDTDYGVEYLGNSLHSLNGSTEHKKTLPGSVRQGCNLELHMKQMGSHRAIRENKPTIEISLCEAG